MITTQKIPDFVFDSNNNMGIHIYDFNTTTFFLLPKIATNISHVEFLRLI